MNDKMKNNFRTGTLVKQRNGNVKIVLMNTPDGDIMVDKEKWSKLSSYDDELNNVLSKQFDIMGVYRNYKTGPVPNMTHLVTDESNLLWKRNEPAEELTMEQVCRELGREIMIKK